MHKSLLQKLGILSIPWKSYEILIIFRTFCKIHWHPAIFWTFISESADHIAYLRLSQFALAFRPCFSFGNAYMSTSYYYTVLVWFIWSYFSGSSLESFVLNAKKEKRVLVTHICGVAHVRSTPCRSLRLSSLNLFHWRFLPQLVCAFLGPKCVVLS